MTKVNSIPFNKMLKIVAIVDEKDPQVQELLQAIAGEGYEIEVSANYQREVFEDASVGAYIVSVDGENSIKAAELNKKTLMLLIYLPYPLPLHLNLHLDKH